MKGRRLPEAAVFVDRELSRGLQEAENWTKDTFQTTRIRTLRFSVLCAGLVSHGWEDVCILAEIAVGECRESLSQVSKISLRQWSACEVLSGSIPACTI